MNQDQSAIQKPLTQGQMLIWTGQQLHPNAPLYNMIFTFEIEGKINEEIFSSSFQSLVDHTDSLRTVFKVRNEIPYQYIHANQNATFEFLDFSSKNEEEYKNWVSEKNSTLFDLEQSTYYTALLKCSDTKYIWYFNQHHISTDATSFQILFNRLEILYRSSVEHTLLETKFPQFASHVKNEISNHSHADKSIEYWNNKYQEAAKTTKLYGYEKAQFTRQSTTSKRITIVLDQLRNHKLNQIIASQELKSITKDFSLNSIFLSTLSLLIHKVSQAQNINIYSPVANRLNKDTKNTSGLFIELFPIKVSIEDDDTFISIYKKSQSQLFDVLKNAKPGLSKFAFKKEINVVLNYITTTFNNFNQYPIKAEWLHPNHIDSNHHLRLHIHDFNNTGQIALHFDLNTSVFPENIIEDIPHHYCSILDAFIHDASQSVNQVSLLSNASYQKLYGAYKNNDFENRPDPKQNNILDLFEKVAAQGPNKTAIIHKSKHFSYQEIRDKVDQYAANLMDHNIKPLDKIGIHLKRSPDFLISILALWKIGATYIPIPSNYPDKRIQYILHNTNAKAILVDKKLSANINLNDSKFIEVSALNKENNASIEHEIFSKDLAYIMYTSGSTGNPKGVEISHKALSHYLTWAQNKYGKIDRAIHMPFYTSTGFDLTVTSMFIPLLDGGSIYIYEEGEVGPDLAILDVIHNKKINTIKLTPSHAELIKAQKYHQSSLDTFILGGEDFTSSLARSLTDSFHDEIDIYNEYGPTESTVGCIVHKYNPEKDNQQSVPIGKVIDGVQAFVFDRFGKLVPQGVPGELYLAGESLAEAYHNNDKLTKDKFSSPDSKIASKMYRTGDLVRINHALEFEYLGRIDDQVKINGHRIELGEVEHAALDIAGINECAVIVQKQIRQKTDDVYNCVSCGLPSNYPNTTFNEQGICNLCQGFENYQVKVQDYFKETNELQQLLTSKKTNGAYDCIALLSGGKDSTYTLAKLIEMGLSVLAFTLDNGYISQQAIANIKRVVTELKVDHIFGTTESMNEIFVDSLQRHCNVCNGCFKTIYTLSTQIALDKNIPFIVTGLSRGQFFETRLTEELFWDEAFDATTIDTKILEARKSYHQVDDAVKRLLDTSMFEDDSVFDKVQFVDFFRFTDVSLEEMYTYLDQKLPWIRPTDTGRSTNCLINQLGIYVHKKEKGFSNYAFPYSWDVRIGHKTRNESLDEINETINEKEVLKMMGEIGFQFNDIKNRQHLIGFYSGKKMDQLEIKNLLNDQLPDFMIPNNFVHLDAFPLSDNGKIDKLKLAELTIERNHQNYLAPENDIEELLADIWEEVLTLQKIGIKDQFLEIGGSSLSAIRIAARIEQNLELKIPVNKIFEHPTIKQLASHIEEIMLHLMEQDK